MTSPTQKFFEDLASLGHVSWFENEHARVRLEVVDEDCLRQWTVEIDNGSVKVDRDASEADGVIRASRALFDRAVTGEEMLMPALLRGEIRIDGSYDLLIQLGRLLPGPPGQTGPRKVGKMHGEAG
jgi:hypothetical protein